jgi:hypothetical protein
MLKQEYSLVAHNDASRHVKPTELEQEEDLGESKLSCYSCYVGLFFIGFL